MPESNGTTEISLRSLPIGGEFVGASDILATRVCVDSRACEPGDLFVAIVGSEDDGHNHIEQALANGASGIVAEQYVPTSGRPLCIVPDSRIALGHIVQALAGNPASQLKLIGITGTNGKTTTTLLIANILRASGKRVGVLGTLGYCDTKQIAAAPLTTPEAPQFAQWLAQMVAAGCTHAVMEVSSHALAQHRVSGVEFDAIGFTNVRRDHLDFHGSLFNYRAAKLRLLDHVRPEGITVLNTDDAVVAKFVERVHGPALTVGMNGPAEITAQLIERCQSEQTFMLMAGDETVVVRTQMIGDHHISNCLVAAAICLAMGIDLPTVARGIEQTGHVPGRLERIEKGQSFGVFVDYAHTPDGLAASLSTLRKVTAGRLICVFGAGGNRDNGKRPQMGKAVESLADMAIITTDNPRFEDPEEIVWQILAGCEDSAAMECIPDRESAIRRAIELAEPGDCVLIAGKGHEPCQLVAGLAIPCDDRQIAKECLANLQPVGSPVAAGLWTVGNN
jgi:UDP-N-acetylmuramoyl-L-alanyl-D-glutamate--2,6-diaminopimelate ligase